MFVFPCAISLEAPVHLHGNDFRVKNGTVHSRLNQERVSQLMFYKKCTHLSPQQPKFNKYTALCRLKVFITRFLFCTDSVNLNSEKKYHEGNYEELLICGKGFSVARPEETKRTENWST
jgi:hypothetical protein